MTAAPPACHFPLFQLPCNRLPRLVCRAAPQSGVLVENVSLRQQLAGHEREIIAMSDTLEVRWGTDCTHITLL